MNRLMIFRTAQRGTFGHFGEVCRAQCPFSNVFFFCLHSVWGNEKKVDGDVEYAAIVGPHVGGALVNLLEAPTRLEIFWVFVVVERY